MSNAIPKRRTFMPGHPEALVGAGDDLALKAGILIEALPYLRRFRGAVVVIKYGGSAMTQSALRDSFAEDVTLLEHVGLRPVVVHGGGPELTKTLRRLGMESRFVDGHPPRSLKK